MLCAANVRFAKLDGSFLDQLTPSVSDNASARKSNTILTRALVLSSACDVSQIGSVKFGISAKMRCTLGSALPNRM